LRRPSQRQLRDGVLAFVSSDGIIHWTSAGHGPVYVREKAGEPLVSLDPPSLPWAWTTTPGPIRSIADEAGHYRKPHGGQRRDFRARSPVGGLFEISRMIDLCDQFQQAVPEAFLAALRDGVRVWECGHERSDDQTIVYVQRNPMS